MEAAAVNSCSLVMARVGTFAAVLAAMTLATAEPVSAQRITKSRTADSDFEWSGLYFGGHVGYARGRARAGITEVNFDQNADLNAPPVPSAVQFRHSIGT